MKEQIIQLFNRKNQHRIVFDPSIKIKRNYDIIYICELFTTHFTGSNTSYKVMVERGTEAAIPMPLALLDDLSLKAIRDQLRCTEEKVMSIEKNEKL